MTGGWKFFLSRNSETIEIVEPLGWDAIEFQTKRLESHGLDQLFTSELTFIGTAAKFIKAAYDEEFVNAQIAFDITSKVKVEGQFYTFSGFLNLAIYSEENACDTNGFKVTVGIMEDQFRTDFLSRTDVEVDLLSLKDLNQNTIPALTLRTVRLHCQELFLQGRAETLAGLTFELDGEAAVYPLYWQNSDFKGVFGSSKNVTQTVWSTTQVQFINNADYGREFIISSARLHFWIVNLDTILSTLFEIRLFIFDETNSIFSYNVLDSEIILARGQYEWDYTITNYSISLPEGYSFNIAIWPSNNVKWTFYIDPFEFRDSYLNLTEINSTEFASICQGLTIEEYLRRLIYILTGDSDGLLSNTFSEALDGCNWNNLLTQGLYIRNADFTITSPAIKNTFKKVFEDLTRIFNLGWEFELGDSGYKIRIEPIEYFYTRTIVKGFQKVNAIRQYALFDKLFNSFSIGYSDKWKNIAVSGSLAIHTNREYFIPNKGRSDDQSSSKLDLKSDIIAEGYAIEFLRRLQFLRDDSGSSDRPNDYDTFIVWLNRYELTIDSILYSGYELPNESGTITFQPGEVSYGSNFIAQSVSAIGRIYNVLHSPVRVAARWWKWIGMNTYGLDTTKAKLFFQTGQYYTVYESRIAGESADEECLEIFGGSLISESANIEPSIFNTGFSIYLLKPIGIEFEAPQSLCDFLTMSNNGSGLINVTHGSVDVSGYIETASNNPVDPKSGLSKFTLYLSNQEPENPDYDHRDYDSRDYF